jgi:hypothetical protein
MAKTLVVEQYLFDSYVGPRDCNGAPAGQGCKAELILHDDKGDFFMCRKHAALHLSKNPTLMASALIDLFLP